MEVREVDVVREVNEVRKVDKVREADEVIVGTQRGGLGQRDG